MQMGRRITNAQLARQAGFQTTTGLCVLVAQAENIQRLATLSVQHVRQTNTALIMPPTALIATGMSPPRVDLRHVTCAAKASTSVL